MFPEIQKAIDEGKCLLEWDHSKGDPPVPLLKDMFSGLRKKAKTMNFSIAYGKTAGGFAKDWNCSVDEANETLRKWYSNRKEVEKWQEDVKKIAIEKGFTQTLLGRYRNLSKKLSNKKTYGHSLRAAINTPIQGGKYCILI
jgi:DNA polymerase-1